MANKTDKLTKVSNLCAKELEANKYIYILFVFY